MLKTPKYLLTVVTNLAPQTSLMANSRATA